MTSVCVVVCLKYILSEVGRGYVCVCVCVWGCTIILLSFSARVHFSCEPQLKSKRIDSVQIVAEQSFVPYKTQIFIQSQGRCIGQLSFQHNFIGIIHEHSLQKRNEHNTIIPGKSIPHRLAYHAHTSIAFRTRFVPIFSFR